jgi:hypothetical protein
VACLEVLVARDAMPREGEGVVVRQGRCIALVAFLIGCSVLLVVGCAGVGSEAPQKEQTHSPQATASEEARCQGTRTVKSPKGGSSARFTTNDLPGCPKGGLLLGTDGPDKLYGGDGDDEIRGLGATDVIVGGDGNDVIYGGPGDDSTLDGRDGDDVIYGGDGDDKWLIDGKGVDVIYGGDGSDHILTIYDHQRDKLYCGKGKDYYGASKNDYVSSSCEKELPSRGVA